MILKNKLYYINTILFLFFILSTVLALNEKCNAEGKTGICKDINDCIGEYKPVSNHCKGEKKIQCCIKRDIIPDETKNKIRTNLNNKLQFDNIKKTAMLEAAEEMLDKGYNPKFIAGMLGNIQNEGTPGMLENSNYTSKTIPCYLQCMNDNFDDYLNEYSSKSITELGVDKIKKLSDKVLNATNSTLSFKSGNNKKCYYFDNNGNIQYKYENGSDISCTPTFGFGMIQWTENTRRNNSLNEYIYYKSHPYKGYGTIKDKPSIVESARIEVNFMLLELERDLINTSFNRIYENWLNGDATPYNAGDRLCRGYEKPANQTVQCTERGKNADKIYNLMDIESTLNEKTNLGLAKYALKQKGKPYWFGTYGQIGTKSLYDQMKKQYPDHYTANDFADQIKQNVRVHDCSGLIKGYLWSDTPDSVPTPNDLQDKNAAMMYDESTEKGEYSSFRKIIGQLVYKKNSKGKICHVGIYIGNDKVIEAKGHADGVIESEYDNSWQLWSQCPYIINDTEYYCDEVNDASIASNKNYTLSMNIEDKFCGIVFDQTDDTDKSTNNRCGPNYGKCPSGQCCNKNGKCGTKATFCSKQNGCQPKYGKCKNIKIVTKKKVVKKVVTKVVTKKKNN